MIRYLTVLVSAVLLAAAAILFTLAPDTISMLILAVMAAVLAMGTVLGIVPILRFSAGFRRALKIIQDAVRVQSSDVTLVMMRENEMFRQKDLDEAFQEYKEIIHRQNHAGEVLRDISEFISEDFLELHTWQGLLAQIPGILTGLGILGTFIGLLSGIGTLSFTSVDAAIDSITLLIAGIGTAFYTSIAGVILSILFNILYRILWNGLIREYSLFLEFYHKQVIPPTEVQLRQSLNNGLRELFRRLDRMPQSPGYSPVHASRDSVVSEGSEKLLMPQVVQAMREGQFIIYLQPIVLLKTRKLVGAEAYVRWQHDTLGLLTPGAFLPVLEKNGYITKLDLHIWDLVCKTLREWIDNGIRPLPVTLNVSKADILAMDVPRAFADLLRQYQLPPRMLELDIASNACEDGTVLSDVLTSLRSMGLKVTMDNFMGDFLALQNMDSLEVDNLKLDLRFQNGNNGDHALEECFAKARTLGIELTVSGIENAAQLTKLEALGCSVGQGFYFYHPMPVEDFEKLAGYQGKA